MYGKFSDFVEHKEAKVFADQFHALCEHIVLSGMSFDEYWENTALPVLIENTYTDETELFVELGLPRFLGGQGIFGGGQPKPDVGQPKPDVAGGMSQSYRDQQSAAKAQRDQARSAKLQNYQGGINQTIEKVKSRFVQAMRDFIQMVSNDAKQGNDWTAWKVAQSFHKKIMQAAQPVLDQFKMTAKFGQRDTSQFDQERGSMQQNHQQNLKKQLLDKHGKPTYKLRPPDPDGGMHQPIAAMHKN